MANRNLLRVGVALVLSTSMWFYVQKILIPYQQQDTIANSRPSGNFSDLYPRWLGARELLLNGRDPYSPEITREIQVGYYGRPLDPERPSDPKDQQAFAYPVFVVFLLSPTVSLPFPQVQEAFLWVLLLITVATIPLWFHFLGWHPSNSTMAVVILLTVGSLPVVQALKLQQLSLLVAGLVALALALLVRGRLALSGILMAFAMIKPQLTVPLAGWLFLWTLSNWRDRRRYLASFGATLAILLAGSEWILPGWMTRFRSAVASYQVYAHSRSLLDALLGDAAGRVIAGAIILTVLFLCWKVRGVGASSPQFSWMCCTVMTATVVIIPTISPYNQVLLLPAILLVARQWPELVKQRPIAHRLAWFCGAVVVWPWLATAVLMFLSAALPSTQVQEWWPLPFYPVLIAPLAGLLLQGVSWRPIDERQASLP
jgi:hypothetical protein